MTAIDERPASAASKDRPSGKVRVPYWDNARFACIVLVVMGHATQRLTSDSNNAYLVYLFIYGFHMPAFAVISGYFSKAEPPGVRQMRRVVTDIIVPYLIMQAIWSLVQFLVEGNRSVNLTEPHWTLWFAVAAIWIADFKRIQFHLWFFYDDSFSDLGGQGPWAGALRVAVLAIGVVLSAAFLLLIPRRQTWFTAFGQATMYVYLLHSFVLYPIRESGVLKDDHASGIWLVSILVASVGIAILLSSPPIRRIFRPVVEPRLDWLFRRHDLRATSPQRVDPTGSRRD